MVASPLRDQPPIQWRMAPARLSWSPSSTPVTEPRRHATVLIRSRSCRMNMPLQHPSPQRPPRAQTYLPFRAPPLSRATTAAAPPFLLVIRSSPSPAMGIPPRQFFLLRVAAHSESPRTAIPFLRETRAVGSCSHRYPAARTPAPHCACSLQAAHAARQRRYSCPSPARKSPRVLQPVHPDPISPAAPSILCYVSDRVCKSSKSRHQQPPHPPRAM